MEVEKMKKILKRIITLSFLLICLMTFSLKSKEEFDNKGKVNAVSLNDIQTVDVATNLTWVITPDKFASVDNTGLVTLKDLTEATTLKVTAKSAEFKVENTFTILATPALEEKFTYNVEFTTDVENIEMNVNKETSRQFAAKIVKTDKDGIKSDVATDLTWSITPDEFASVDNTGLVTVQELAEATTLKVTAKSAEFDVENSFDILAKPALKAGEEFDFYGETYIDLKDLGDGNHLVLRKFLLPANKNSSTSVAYNDSNLNKTMKAYYAGLKPEAQAVVQPVKKTFTLGMGDVATFGLDANSFLMSSPAPDYAKVTSNGGEKKAFALSTAELNDVSGEDQAFPTKESRAAASEATPATTIFWWLRTPFSSKYVWGVGHDSIAGKFGYGAPSTAVGVRPALIIHL